MVALKKFNLDGQEVGEMRLEGDFLRVEAHPQLVKDYIIAIRANARQWSASTKGRSEVVHTTKKPHKQKGTGSARQGSLVSPQFRGGGIVFGPKPKFDQHVRINRKEKRLAVQALLVEKIQGQQLIVLDDQALEKALKQPQTKSVAKLLKGKNLFGRHVLFVGEGTYENVQTEGVKAKVSVHSSKLQHLKLSTRNIPQAQFSLAANLNGYDLMVAKSVVITESALKELQQQMSAEQR